MKKVLSVFLALAVVAISIPLYVSAAEMLTITIGKNFKGKIYDGEECELSIEDVSVSSESGNVKLPENQGDFSIRYYYFGGETPAVGDNPMLPPTDAGNYYVKVVYDGNNAVYYGSASKNFNITKKSVKVGAITPNNKVYDGTTDLTLASITFDEDVSGISGIENIVPNIDYVAGTFAFRNANVAYTAEGEVKNVMTTAGIGEAIEFPSTSEILKNYMPDFANLSLKPAQITPKPLTTVSIAEISSYTYTGDEICPEPELSFFTGIEKFTLTKDTDFTYSYIDNTDASETATVKVTATEKGNYLGEDTRNFKITKRNLSEANIADIEGIEYTGSEIKPEPEVSIGEGEDKVVLQKGVDFDYSYQRNTDIGTATLTITGLEGNYTGTKSKDFLVLGTLLTAEVTVNNKTYDGNNIATIDANGVVFKDTNQNIVSLAKNDDYTISDLTFDSAEVGTGKTVTGTVALVNGGPLSKNYSMLPGSVTFNTADIEKASGTALGKSDTIIHKSMPVPNSTANYELSNLVGTVSLPLVLGDIVSYKVSSITDSNSILSAPAAGEGLIMASTMTVTTKADVLSGQTAEINLLINTDNYKDIPGTLTVSIGERDELTVDFTVAGGTYSGNSYGISNITFKKGEDPVQLDSDRYTVSYYNKDNLQAALGSEPVDAGTYTAVVEIKADDIHYFGSKSKDFTIDKKSFSGVTVDPLSDEVYSGSAFKPDVTVKDGTKTLVKDTDYSVVYANNVNAGQATITINGKNNYTNDTKNVSFNIARKAVAGLTVNGLANVTYNGLEHIPAVTVLDGSVTLVKDRDYELAYSNNVNAGIASVTVTGIGNYKDTLPKSFTIDKQELIISADNKSAVVGDIEPEYTYTVTGIVNSEAPDNVILTKPALTCPLADMDISGTYAIEVDISGVTLNANYKLGTPVNGILTVTQPSSGNTGTTTVTDREDGATVITIVYPDGSKTETIYKEDGAVIEKKTAVDGTETSKTTMPDGTVATTVKDRDGNVVSEVAVPPGTGSGPVEIPIDDADTNTVAVIVHEDGTREVISKGTVGTDGVTITVSDSCTVEIINNSKGFADVKNTAWYKDNVDFVSSRELLSGTSEDKFSPRKKVTRGMFAAVLWRLDQAPESSSSQFMDIKPEAYYAQAAKWGNETGIMTGVTDTRFSPTKYIKRQDIAIMLYRYAQREGIDIATNGDLSSFKDASKVGGYAVQAMKWATENGIITGSGGYLNPRTGATRAEVSAMLQRFIDYMLK